MTANITMADNSTMAEPSTLREKLAQLLFVRIGSNLPPVRKVREDAERIEQLLSECPIGGLLLFNGSLESTPETLARLQEASRFPLLVSSDIERGVGQQIHGYSLFPHAMSFSGLGSEAESAVKRFAELKAKLARANGIHISLGPSADVNVDPRNPIIATRAFGSDPEEVSRLVMAYVRECQKHGLLSTAKHYPGHGNTHEDSHHELPTVHATREEMERCELAPFRAAITAGVSLIMTAHVRYPALDASGKCATLSKAILTGLLREKLGFEGAIITDSLLMEGVKSQCVGEGALVVEALNAGVDILLDVAEPLAAVDALERAVLDGKLAEQRVEEAFARVQHLKQVAFAGTEQAPIDQAIVTETHLFAEEVATNSITIVSDPNSVLPLAKDKKLSAFLVRSHTSRLDPPEQPLGAALREHFPECDYYELEPDTDANELMRFAQIAEASEQVLVAIVVKPAAWHQFGLLEEQVAFVDRLTQLDSSVLVSLGTPEALVPYPANTTKVCTFSDVPLSQESVVRWVTKMV